MILQHPSYVTYCRRIVGKMVRVWNGPLVSSRGQPEWKQQRRNDNQQQPGRLLGREVQLLSQQPSGCTIYRVLGFDSITGTHLLKCIPIPVEEEKVGIPEVSPEEYVQVVLAECFYQVLISDEEREDSVPGSSLSSVNEAKSSILSHGKDRFSVGSDRKIQVRPGYSKLVCECRRCYIALEKIIRLCMVVTLNL